MRSLKGKKINLTDEVRIDKYTVENNSYDKLLFSDISRLNAPVVSFLEDPESKTPTIKEMGQDLFSLIYKYNPEMTPKNRVKLSHIINSEVSKQITEMSEYKELRNISRLDEMTSAFAFEVMAPLVKKQLTDLQEEVNKIQEAMNISTNSDEDEEDGLSDKAGEYGNSVNELTEEEAKAQLEEYLEKVQNLVKEKKVQRDIQTMLKAGIEEAQQVSDLIQNWGLGSSDSFINGNYESKFELLNYLRKSKKLKEIAQLAGRYKELAARTQREKVQHGMNEVYEITQGTDLSKLLPTEKMKFRHPILRKLVLKDWLEHKTLQYNTRSKEKKQKGPIVVCIDSSGSMSGPPEVWSKSVALGILEICKIQKRDMYVIQFECESRKSDLQCNSFIRNKYNIKDIIEMAEYFSGGGTMFEPALSLAQDKINTMPEFTKADIIFITDGEAPVGDTWLKKFLEWKKAKQISIISVLIDASYCSDVTLKRFSDNIFKLSTLREKHADGLAVDLFASI